jgi:hypothetical protein
MMNISPRFAIPDDLPAAVWISVQSCLGAEVD